MIAFASVSLIRAFRVKGRPFSRLDRIALIQKGLTRNGGVIDGERLSMNAETFPGRPRLKLLRFS